MVDGVTCTSGQVVMQDKPNGNYSVVLSRDGYKDKEIDKYLSCDLKECEKCKLHWRMDMEQPRCKDTFFPVTVTDFYEHEKPISNALVSLYQVSSIGGPSNDLIDSKRTHLNGTAIFTLQMNGK